MKKITLLLSILGLSFLQAFSQSAGTLQDGPIKIYSGGNVSITWKIPPSPVTGLDKVEWYFTKHDGNNPVQCGGGSYYSNGLGVSESGYVFCKVFWVGGNSANTNEIYVNVLPSFSAGSIQASKTTVCYNESAVNFNFSSSPYGGEGTKTYQWYYSTNNSTWIPVNGATNNTYTPDYNHTESRYYKCMVEGGAGALSTNSVLISVRNDLNPGVIAGDGSTSICENNAAPALSFSTVPSGETNVFTYQWQSSGNNSTWNNIASATSDTYNPGNISSTTYYKAIVTGACNVPKSTNTITVTTTAASSVAEPQTNVEAVYCKNQHVVIDVTNANSHNNWYNESSFLLTDSPSFEIDTLKATTQLYIEAVDVNGCKTAKKLVTINMDPIAANFTVSDNNIKVAEITSVASTSTGVISSYFWDMGNGMEYNSANAAVYYNTPGIFSIQLKIVSENGCKDSLTLENAVRVNRSSNTSEISKEDLFIYPSRISNVLTIEYSGEPGATAFVYSSEGKLLREQKLTGNKNQMDLSSLNPGSYFIKITTNSGDDYIRNFIKTR